MVERKLGKGGFGQVYVGRRAQQTTAKDGPNANFVSLHILQPHCDMGHVVHTAHVPSMQLKLQPHLLCMASSLSCHLS